MNINDINGIILIARVHKINVMTGMVEGNPFYVGYSYERKRLVANDGGNMIFSEYEVEGLEEAIELAHSLYSTSKIYIAEGLLEC